MIDRVQSDLESKIFSLIVTHAGHNKMRPTDWGTIVAACKGSSEDDIMEAIRSLIAKGAIHKDGGWLPGPGGAL